MTHNKNVQVQFTFSKIKMVYVIILIYYIFTMDFSLIFFLNLFYLFLITYSNIP